jgi:DNA-binding response OmpR family regulator
MMPILTMWYRTPKSSDPRTEDRRTRVLVVEDELLIGEIAGEALEEAGFRSLVAASAEEAEVILSREAVDVLFTDINLGGRDGFHLAERAVSMQPGLEVVFASGKSRRCHGNRILDDASFLAKPYRLAELVAEIRRPAQSRTYQ